jgi:hypothetical protein
MGSLFPPSSSSSHGRLRSCENRNFGFDRTDEAACVQQLSAGGNRWRCDQQCPSAACQASAAPDRPLPTLSTNTKPTSPVDYFGLELATLQLSKTVHMPADLCLLGRGLRRPPHFRVRLRMLGGQGRSHVDCKSRPAMTLDISFALVNTHAAELNRVW